MKKGGRLERSPLFVVIACDKREAFAQGSASDETIQSRYQALDCFAEPVIGRAFARPVGSQ